MNLDRVKQINQLARLEASKALSKFLQSPVTIGMNLVEVKPAQELAAGLPPEEVVVGITAALAGDLAGSALLVLPKETAFAFCDFSLQRPRGQTQRIQAEERSLLEEVGNIVVGNYLRVFSRGAGLKCLLHQAPDFAWDTVGNLIHRIIPSQDASFRKQALFVEIIFSFEQATVKGYVMLLCEIQHLQAALGAL